MDWTRICKSLPMIFLLTSLICACGNDEDTGSGNQRALQLLWSERKLSFDTKLLEISEIQHIPNAEQKRPERKVQGTKSI